MTAFHRYLPALLALVCLLGLSACQTAPAQDTVTTAAPAPVTEPASTDLVLVSGGEAKVQLIRSDDANAETTAEFTRLYKKIAEVTGVYPEFTTDYIRGTHTRSAEEDGIPAILAGQTNYSASGEVIRGLSYGEGVAKVVGQQLIVAAVDQSAAIQLVDELCAYIEANGRAGELSIPADYSLTVEASEQLMGVPVVDGGIFAGRTDVGDNAYTLNIGHVTSEEYDAYRARLAESGLTQYSASEIGKNRFVTYISDAFVYNYLYTPTDEMLRVVIDKKSNTALPPVAEPAYTKVCDTSLTQLGLEYNYDNPSNPYKFTQSDWQIGMCYIFRLEDGSFIIIDGGFNQGRNAKMLWDKLKELSADYKPNKITIAAWFLTHAHGDHYGTFKNFMETYGQHVELNYLVYNAASDAQYKSCNSSAGGMTAVAATYVPKAKTIIARPGQTMQLANADVEMIFSDEFLDASVKSANSLCIHFRITVAGQTFMFAGDSDTDATNQVVKLYGKELASDFVQVIHHGATGGTVAYYQCVDPTIVLWPLGEYDYFVDTGVPGKTTRSTETYNSYIFTSTKIREVILAGHTDRTIALPYAYPADRVDPVRVG